MLVSYNMNRIFLYTQIIKILLSKKYKEYNVTYNKNKFFIIYNRKKYFISVEKENNDYYIMLNPYKSSYFKTSINIKDLKMKLDMTLFAMKEN